MQIMNLLFFLPIMQNKKTVELSNHIIDYDKPSCVNCKFYKPTVYSSFDNNGKCTNYGYKNIENDKIYYEYSIICRNNEDKCGKNGLSYVAEKNLNNKKIMHHINSYRDAYIALLITILFTLINSRLKL